MRLGYDAKRLFCNNTGLGNYSRTLVENLSNHYPQHKLNLYTPKIKMDLGERFTDTSSYKTHVSSHAFKAYWRSFSIVNQLIKDEVEIYHGLSNELPFRINTSNIKSVLTIHDLIFKVLPDTYSPIDRTIYDFKSKTSCQNADKIIAISESTKKDIIKFYGIDPDKISVIYQACDPLFYKTPLDEDIARTKLAYGLPAEYLLYVGSIQTRKNVEVLIDACAILPPQDQIPLVLVGRGRAYKKKMRQKIHALGIESKIIWIDNLRDNTQLQCIYAAAKILIYPSHYEGFGLPVAEALLSKTPVITSNRSSLPEAGGPDSIYIDPNDSEHLSSAISSVLADEDLRQSMIDHGYAYALETFSPEKLTQQLITCYNGLLA